MPKTSTNTVILAICAMVWVLLVLRLWGHQSIPDPRPMTAEQAEVTQFAKMQLDRLQPRSFSEDRELCGIIVEDEAGNLSVPEITRGEEASCGFGYDGYPGLNPVASFHTHGTFSFRYDGEVPSIVDLRNDIELRLDGYVATPGGRLWRIDWQNETAELICGEGCLQQDPSYIPCPQTEPETRYSLSSLNERYTGWPARC